MNANEDLIVADTARPTRGLAIFGAGLLCIVGLVMVMESLIAKRRRPSS